MRAMTKREAEIAWAEIRKRVEEVSRLHGPDCGHELCHWGFGDATEFPAAFDYVEAVIQHWNER